MNLLFTTFTVMLFSCIGVLKANAAGLEFSAQQAVLDAVFEVRVPGPIGLRGHATVVGDLTHFDRRILQFKIQYDDAPVFFQTGVVELDETGHVTRVRNPLETLLPPVLELPFPDDNTISDWVAGRGSECRPPYERGYYVLPSSQLIAAVRVETVSQTPHAQAWYLDASDGRILFTEPLFQTQSVSQNALPADAVENATGNLGAVYLENPRITPELQIVSLGNLDEDAVHLYGRYARVESCVDTEECKDISPVAIRKDTVGEEFVFSPTSDVDAQDPFAEVNAYYNINSVADWVHTTFGWDKRFGGETWIQVKVGRYWDNAAYYAGSDKKAPYIVFGKTEEMNFAYDADTARHEYGHAINDLFWDHPWSRTDEFGMDISMIAIEESLADIWALNYTGDPMLNGAPGFSRNADNRYTCPGNILGEGHLDARFVDGFAWDLREVLGRNVFENVLYRSLSFMNNEAGYDDFVAALESATESLVDEGVEGVAVRHLDAIRETARARGLLDEDCLRRIVPLVDRQKRAAVGYGRPRTRQMDYPFPLQWKVPIFEDGATASLFFTWLVPETNEDGEPVQPGYRVHIRRDAPVEVVWLESEYQVAGEPAFTVIADHTFDDSPELITYPTDGQPASTAGESFYVMLSARTDEPIVAIQARLYMNTAASSSPPPSDETAPVYDFSSATGAPSCQTALPASNDRLSFVLSIIKTLF